MAWAFFMRYIRTLWPLLALTFLGGTAQFLSTQPDTPTLLIIFLLPLITAASKYIRDRWNVNLPV